MQELTERVVMYLEIKNHVLRSLNLNFQVDDGLSGKGAAMPLQRRIHTYIPSALFLREFARNPKSIGAVCSSSERLGNRMARHIELHEDGWVVELGGGTGAITQALLLHGVAARRLIVVEKSHGLAVHLSNRFPEIRVIHGDAADMELILNGSLPVRTIVSGLPLRSLSRNAVISITDACVKILHPQGRLIQFTYAPGGFSPWLSAGLEKLGSETVWTNIPPARIDVFTCSPGPNPALN
jgi:phosphatidylethanolamine/phosphatidyl-N-methylethanolamine N-methyltransferase